MVATVAPAPAQADQLSDLMALVASLQAQIAALQGGTPAAAGTGLCAGVTFTRTLAYGSTGTDVKCLQQLLSVTPTSGWFGNVTLAAVRAYQTTKGWTPANQVGPMTIAALNAQLAGAGTPGAPVVPGTPGATGFIDAGTLAASPASNSNVITTSNIPVLGVNVKAIGSNMTVNSIQVKLAATKSSATEHPATSVTNLYVYDGSTLLGTFPVNTSTVIKDSSNYYYVILSGFRFTVPVNTTKILTVSADFTPSMEYDRELTVSIYNTTTGVGAVDGAGATRTSGNASTRVFTLNYDTVGTSVLTVTAATATPLSSSVKTSSTVATIDVPMAVFTAHSTTGASKITDMKFIVTGDDANVAKVSSLKLYDGTTLLASKALTGTVSGAYASLTDLSIVVAQDAYKDLTVKADFASDVAADTTGVRVIIDAPNRDVTYEKPNLASTNPTSGAQVVGNYMHVFDDFVPVISLYGTPTVAYSLNTTTASLGYTTGVIAFKVRASGGTVTALTTSTVKVKWNTTVMASAKLSVDFQPVGGTNGANLADGGEAIVTVTATIPRGSAADSANTYQAFVNFSIYEIDWTGGATINQTWGLGDFKTPYANVQ